LFKLYHLKSIEFVGHGDSAGYAMMAKNLLLGKGFNVDYIQTFFTEYRTIHRPQDLWYPLNSMIIVPFYFFFGISAFVAKIPNTILACYGLPLLTYFLARNMNVNKPYFPLFASLVVLLNPAIWMESMTVYAEILIAFLHTGAILFFIKGLEKKQWFIAMGFFTGLAVLAKLTGFLLLISLIISFLLIREYKHFKIFLVSIAIAIIIPFPWFVRNWINFKDPFYSLTKYYGGLHIEEKTDYEEDYRIYWDTKKPSTIDKIMNLGTKGYAFYAFNNFKKAIRIVFLGYDVNDFKNIKYLLGNKFETFIFGVPSLVGVFLFFKNKKVIPIYVMTFSYIIVFSLFWFPLSRYFTLTIPGIVVIGLMTYLMLIKWIEKKICNNKRLLYVSVSALIIICMIFLAHSFRIGNKVGWYPHSDSGKEVLILSKWLKENTNQNDVVMITLPVELNFHSGRPTIQIPYENFEKIMMIIKKYNVKYLVPDFNRRPALKEIISYSAVFSPVEVDGIEIYKIIE
jgi:uncharacterized membrane protein YqjE